MAALPICCRRVGADPRPCGGWPIPEEFATSRVRSWAPTGGRRATIAVLLLVGCAFALRIYGIGTLPFNYDEPKNLGIIASIERLDPEPRRRRAGHRRPGKVAPPRNAQSVTVANLRLPLHSFRHPPLSAYVSRVGTAIFGSDAFGGRFVNVLVGAASVLVMFLLAKRGFGSERVGVLAAVLLATNRFHIGWSRHIDQEVLYLALIALAMLLFWRVHQRGVGWIPLTVVVGCSILAKEMAALLILPIVIFLAIDQRGRQLLRTREFRFFLLGTGVVAALVAILSVQYPQDGQFSLHVNLDRASRIGIHSEPLEFFLMPLNRHDPLPRSWAYPSMFWVTGAILLASVVYSLAHRRDPFVAFNLVVFAFYFGVFSIIGDIPSVGAEHRGEFWWTDVALISAILLAANMLARLGQRNRFSRWALAFVVVYLFLNAAFFVAITPGGPILAYLGASFEDVVVRIPFLL